MNRIITLLAIFSSFSIAAHAQSSEFPQFNTAEERQEWITANPDEIRRIRDERQKQSTRAVATPTAAQPQPSKRLNSEEREALITRYETLIAENKGREGFDHAAYSARIETLKAQRGR